MGIRMALGAGRRDILRIVLGDGIRLCAISLALGVPAALALSQLLRSQLYGVTPNDPVTFVIAVVVLSASALTAIYLPARRAAKIDPMLALRHE
jgi:ABC-type antimicrobial peptide transport system permease subunit